MIVQGKLTIDSGPGNDHVELIDTVLEGTNTAVAAQAGSDTIVVDDSRFRGRTLFDTGSPRRQRFGLADLLDRFLDSRGDGDTLRIERSGAPDGPPTIFDGPFAFRGSPGADRVEIGVPGEPGNRAEFGDSLWDGGPGRNTMNAGLDENPNPHGNQFTPRPRMRRFRR